MAEIRINATGGVKLYDADDSHYAQILAGTISSNVDALTLGSSSADFGIPVTVGEDDTGHDVKLFGATASRYWLWDESADGVVQRGTLTVGVDDTGHDVKLFGASAGAYMEWDESEDQLRIMGASADATTSTGKLLLATSLTDINANDVIGKIDFQAPHEAGGTDAITVAASIRAIAQATFTSSVNATDLIFYTGHSEAAAEKVRFTSQNEIGIAGANYGTDGQVLTSGGAGAAVAWEDASGAVTALNNATANELVTVGSTTTELDAESGLTYTDGALVIGGTTPSLTIGDAGAEDTKLVFDGNAQDYHIGLDDSADSLVIGLGSALGTTTHMSFDATGAILKPLQPAFHAHTAAAQSFSSGNSDVAFATEIFDQNADYATPTFTAPVAGRYLFTYNLILTTVAGTQIEAKLSTSNATFTRTSGTDNNDGDGDYTIHNTVFCHMDASDTVKLILYVNDTSTGQSATASFFSGHLVC